MQCYRRDLTKLDAPRLRCPDASSAALISALSQINPEALVYLDQWWPDGGLTDPASGREHAG
jgi:hypothetical protein